VFGLSALALTALAGLAGCENLAPPPGESVTAVRLNPTPELQSVTKRQDDIDNTVTFAMDEGWRAAASDMARTVLYVDRPSRLDPYPRIR